MMHLGDIQKLMFHEIYKAKENGIDPNSLKLPSDKSMEDEIRVIRTIGIQIEQSGGWNFEKEVEKVDLVSAGDEMFVRLTLYTCGSGANGRPVAAWEYSYFPVAFECASQLTEENWQDYAEWLPLYMTRGGGNEPLY